MLVKTYETSLVLCKNTFCFLPIFNLSFLSLISILIKYLIEERD